MRAVTERHGRRLFFLMGAMLLVPSICVVAILVFGNSDCYYFENFSYYRLPSSAQDLEQITRKNTRSCTKWIRFRISPNELDSFLATTFIQKPLSSTELPESIGSITERQQETGWQVDSLTPYLAGEASGTGDRFLDYQMIFIDTSNPEEYIVYLTTKANWL